MKPDFEKLATSLQAPGVWANIGDLQIDLLVALKYAEAKIAAADEMADKISALQAGLRTGMLAPRLAEIAGKARDEYESVAIAEVPSVRAESVPEKAAKRGKGK